MNKKSNTSKDSADKLFKGIKRKTRNVLRYLGRSIWRKWIGYHRRNRVDTKMHRVELLG